MTSSTTATALAFAEERDRKRHLPVLFGKSSPLPEGEEGKKVSCTRGCTSCCHGPKSVPLLEAVERVAAGGKEFQEFLKSRLPSLEEDCFRDLSTSPGIASLARLPCTFLASTSGDCSVYDHRPLQCRKTWVSSHPSHCDPQRMGEGVVSYPTPASDALISFLSEKGKESGLSFPTLPLSFAYYLGLKIAEGAVSLSQVDRYLSQFVSKKAAGQVL